MSPYLHGIKLQLSTLLKASPEKQLVNLLLVYLFCIFVLWSKAALECFQIAGDKHAFEHCFNRLMADSLYMLGNPS